MSDSISDPKAANELFSIGLLSSFQSYVFINPKITILKYQKHTLRQQPAVKYMLVYLQFFNNIVMSTLQETLAQSCWNLQ